MPSPLERAGLPLLPLAVDGLGTLLAAGGILVLFVPEVLPSGLAGSLTPAVGWTAVAVGAALCAAGTFQLLNELRRRDG